MPSGGTWSPDGVPHFPAAVAAPCLWFRLGLCLLHIIVSFTGGAASWQGSGHVWHRTHQGGPTCGLH